MTSKLFSLGFDPVFLVAVIAAVALVALVVAIIAMLRCTRMWRRYDRFMRGKDARSLEEIINQIVGEVTALSERQDELEKATREVVRDSKGSFKKIAIKRYNGFKESGGKLSFSFALLDQENNGFLMTCMHANGPSYTYLKEIIRGESYVSLSAEETEVLEEAIRFEKYD